MAVIKSYKLSMEEAVCFLSSFLIERDGYDKVTNYSAKVVSVNGKASHIEIDLLDTSPPVPPVLPSGPNPTSSGVYYFRGLYSEINPSNTVQSSLGDGWYEYNSALQMACRFGIEEKFSLDKFRGRWYGPVKEPKL